MDKDLNIKLRLEKETDYRLVEEVTREAFWNVYQPGCEEHFLLNNLRKEPQFVEQLDIVATVEDTIVGNIVYVETQIVDTEGGVHKTLTFGPVSVLPEYQNRGIGSKLIRHTINLAKDMEHKAIIIFGDPLYYQKFGFAPSKQFGITNIEGKYPAAMLVIELHTHSLKGINGIYDDGNIYNLDATGNSFEEFDKLFPNKEKVHSQSQNRFVELVSKYL